MDQLLGLGLLTFGQVIQHVSRFMNPTALRLGSRVCLPQRRPKPQPAIADGHRRGRGQPPGFEALEERLPRQFALALAVLDGDPLFAAVSGGPNDDQHAGPIGGQADVEIDAVSPDIDLVLVGQIPLVPPLVFLVPKRFEPDDIGRG